MPRNSGSKISETKSIGGSDFEANPVGSKPCAVILAAGFSSRMGAFKPLLEIGGKSSLAHLIEVNRKAGVDDIIVVTGHEREALINAIEAGGATEAYNENYERGMFTSIQAGIQKVLDLGEENSVLLYLVDVPLVGHASIEKVLKAHSENMDSLVVASYKNKKGHPILIPQKYLQAILDYDGENGLKGFTRRHNDAIIRIETGDEGVILDMDTPEDYREMLRYYDAPDDELFNFKGRLILVRHGTTKQHSKKIFLGQTDISLNNEGREESFNAAQKLRAENLKPKKIYSSDLKRAMETAEIIRDEILPGLEIQPERAFREMCLGDWDGKYISDIQNEFPEEYKKRGEDILFYKRDGGENYFDLRYRVIKQLYRILNTEKEGDILIVSHRGVIKAIIENIKKLPPEESWELKIPRGGLEILEIDS